MNSYAVMALGFSVLAICSLIFLGGTLLGWGGLGFFSICAFFMVWLDEKEEKKQAIKDKRIDDLEKRVEELERKPNASNPS